MKLRDILIEAPFMVKQSGYPKDFGERSQQDVDFATNNPWKYKEKYREGDISFREDFRGYVITVWLDEEAIGVMHLKPVMLSKIIGATAHQVMNVWIDPKHRNKRIGLKLYNYVLHQRKEGFASHEFMTPASRRIYTSLLDDPSVDVYALLRNEDGTFRRVELNKRTRGLTTGSTVDDARAAFVAVAL